MAVTPPEIITATPTDRDRVIATVVAAFVADPAFRFFFPDSETYASYAAAFAGYLFDRRVETSTVWLAEQGASVALWDPPQGTEHSSTLDLPADVLGRLDAYESAAQVLLPSTPHWYLGVLATHPDAAGRRLGRALIATGVERARADGLPAYLETTNPDNVDLYRRAGWEVTGTALVGTLPIWVLAAGPDPAS